MPWTFRRVARIAASIALLPVLVVLLWWEVGAATQVLWDSVVGYSSPSQIQWSGCVWSLAFVIAGPAAVVLTTVLTRRRRLTYSERIVRVELAGVLVAFPIALFLFLVAAASSII